MELNELTDNQLSQLREQLRKLQADCKKEQQRRYDERYQPKYEWDIEPSDLGVDVEEHKLGENDDYEDGKIVNSITGEIQYLDEPTPSVEIPHLAEEEEEEEEVGKELYEAMEETNRAKEELNREYEALEILEQQRDGVKLDVSGLLDYLRIQLETDSYRKIQQALKAIRQVAPDAVQCKLNASKSALKEQAEAILA